MPLALSATDDFPVLSFGGEAVLSFGGEAVLSLGGHSVLDPAIQTTLLFGGTVLDSKITLTHADRIGRCVVTGTGYAALLDHHDQGTVRHDPRRNVRRGDSRSPDANYASWAGPHIRSATSIIASDICPDLIFGYEFLSQAITLVADAGNVVWCVDERGVVIARSRDHLVRFDATPRGAGFTVREGVNGTVERIEHREDPTNFANEVTVIGSAPQISTARDVFTGNGATTSLAARLPGGCRNRRGCGRRELAVFKTWRASEATATPGRWIPGKPGSCSATATRRLRGGWKVRVTYNFHLPVIHTASDAASIATYGLVAAPVEEDPELDTIESVSPAGDCEAAAAHLPDAGA